MFQIFKAAFLSQMPGPMLSRKTEQDALNWFGDDGALSQAQVDALPLRVLCAVCAGLFF